MLWFSLRDGFTLLGILNSAIGVALPVIVIRWLSLDWKVGHPSHQHSMTMIQMFRTAALVGLGAAAGYVAFWTYSGCVIDVIEEIACTALGGLAGYLCELGFRRAIAAKRFSLRTLFIATTLLAVALGLVVRASF